MTRHEHDWKRVPLFGSWICIACKVTRKKKPKEASR